VRLRVALAGLAGCGAWLIAVAAAASPVLADAGPHQAAANNGSAGLAGDCAACHRAHTAQVADLLRSAVPGLCLACHDGTGATTDVVDGLQFVPDGAGSPTTTTLGALRGGGFAYSLLDSSHAVRLIASGQFLGRVGVLGAAAKQPVTSTHGGDGTVWGNGPDGTAGAGAGPATLTCTSCHNPHGNGQYRILQTRPGEEWAAAGVAAWRPASQAVEISDVVNPTGAALNYTVLPGALASTVLTAGYTPTQGDYWRRRSPWYLNSGVKDNMQVGWNGVSPTNAAANGGVSPPNSSGLMTAWCISCHTRYSGLVNADYVSSSVTPQPDEIFKYRHLTMNYGCEQCHVSHGSNALMTTASELTLTNPDGSLPDPIPSAGPAGARVTSGDSRLLKLDERGTCQLCHDPTTNDPADGYVGPVPSPGAP
jgi:predicted CXXCH cytochrome family protein